MTSKPWIARTTIGAALVICGAFAHWWLTRPIIQIEPPAPAIQQTDGSLILERKPDPGAKPKQQIPRGAKVERIAQVTVQPTITTPAPGQPCPPVTVDLTTIDTGDGMRRILASSEDGRVIGGIDIPIAPIILPPPAKRWAAGMSWAPSDSTYGAWVERDLDILGIEVRAGIEINQARGSGIESRLRIGVAF